MTPFCHFRSRVVSPLLLGGVFFGLLACSPVSFSSDYSSCQVVVEQGTDYSVDNPILTVERGQDAVFLIRCNNGAALAGCDYANYQINENEGAYQLELKTILYSVVVHLELSYRYCAYYANGGSRSDGGDSSEAIRKAVPQNHRRANSDNGQRLFSREGYALWGWNTQADGTGTSVGLGSRFDYSSGAQLYAQWIKETASTHFTYRLENGGVSIISYQGNDSLVVVPSAIEGQPTRRILSDAFQNGALETLFLPASLRFIEKNAFSCPLLATLCFSDSLGQVFDESFANCPRLKTLHINAAGAPVYSGTYFDAFSDKMDWLKSLQTQKKIVLFSGSSGRFGYDSPLIREAFPSYQVADMGVYAYTNARLQLDLIRLFMKKDDVLLSAPEFDATAMQFCTSNAFDRYFYAMVESDYDLLTLLDATLYSHIFSSYTDYAAVKEGMDAKSYFLSPRNFDDEGNPIAYPTYNDYGDYTLKRPNSAQDVLQAYAYCAYTREAIPLTYVQSLNAEYQRFAEQEITVFFSYTPRNWSSLTAQSTKEKRAELDNFLQTSIGVKVISNLEDYLFSGIYFYKVDSHLSSEGAKIRTRKIISDLSQAGLVA